MTAPRCRALILFPTVLEAKGVDFRPTASDVVALVGFGLVTSAARAAALLAEYRPKELILVGLAGTYDVERFPIGTAKRFDSVAVDGIGRGEGSDFVSATELGFPLYESDDDLIEDQIDLVPEGGQLLLSVAAASANPESRARRRARWPMALAEDMEGYAVAVAATLARTKLIILRAASNEVGNVDARTWEFRRCFAALRDALEKRSEIHE